MNAVHYTAVESLRDGRTLHIRAVRPTDRAELLAAFERASDETRYRRFFAPKNAITEQELDSFLHIDFVHHVALAAMLDETEDRKLFAGGARYALAEPGRAELAIAVDDTHQKLGIGTYLLRHLILIAGEAGLHTLSAEVLSDNTPMLKLFERSGLDMRLYHQSGIAYVRLGLSRKNQRPAAKNFNVTQ